MTKVKPVVFYPPVLLIIFAVILKFINANLFDQVINAANQWMLGSFGWLFELGPLVMLIVVVGIYFSRLGDVKIGGAQAKPLLNKFQWFSVSLTTSIAIGILFWATAEPMYHMITPPISMGIQPNGSAAAIFSLSTLFLHWTFTPYAIYAIPTIMFAFAYYNMKLSYSLSSTLVPALGLRVQGRAGQIIDAVCLYALVAGMAASLGTGVLTVTGGLNYLFNTPSNSMVWLIVDIVIVAVFVLSAITGLMNGVKSLSQINTWIFVGLAVFVFVFGPTKFILNIGVEAMGDYLQHFFSKSLFTGQTSGDSWPQNWTIFYFANWLAWAPITGLFLGRISYGYKVKELIIINFLLPSLFGIVWMSIFGGGAIYAQLHGSQIAEAVTKIGPEAAVYKFLSDYPIPTIIIPIFIFTAFLSYVTGADAMTSSMGGMSTTGISPESPEPTIAMKIFWGILLLLISWIMLSSSGINGIKMLSNLGGFPALLLELFMTCSIVMIARNPKKYDIHHDNYLN